MTPPWLEDDEETTAIAEINTTPLIDVLLVLLIMVIVTVPVRSHLMEATPSANASATPPAPAVTIEVAADGTVLWDGTALPDAAALDRRMDDLARAPEQPVIRLRGDDASAYGSVAAVMVSAQRHALRKVVLIDR